MTAPAIEARASTDDLQSALVNIGQFRVVEQAQLNAGVMREKQINSAGLSDGKSARQKPTADQER